MTDRQTDQPTDRLTDRRAYREVSLQLNYRSRNKENSVPSQGASLYPSTTKLGLKTYSFALFFLRVKLKRFRSNSGI